MESSLIICSACRNVPPYKGLPGLRKCRQILEAFSIHAPVEALGPKTDNCYLFLYAASKENKEWILRTK